MILVPSTRPPAPTLGSSATWTFNRTSVYAQNDAVPFNLSRGDYLHIDRTDAYESARNQNRSPTRMSVRARLSLIR
jgi:hypothetical protein